MTLREDAARLLPELVDLRRRLHRIPEVGFDLPQTQAVVLAELADLGLEITTGSDLGSVTAVLRGAADGPSVLLRGDMDALAIVEETGLEYASVNGAMHACGHDLHVAGLVGAARLLAARRESIAGSVVFMFQPGEEAGGGAPLMIRDGVLDAAGTRVEAAYGIHVGPGERGTFQLKPGTIMAGANVLKVTVHGRGGHGSRPHQAVDPVPAVAEIVLALQSWVTRRVDVFDPVVLSVTKLFASEVVNVIPEQAGLAATLRTLSQASIAQAQAELPLLVERIAAAHGCTADVEVIIGYPVTVNTVPETAAATAVLREEFGNDRVEELAVPWMASEDFSFVLREVPGTFLFLSATPPHVDPDDIPMNHSPHAVFDDAVLGDQAAALAALALRHVSR
ncbi:MULTISPECIES: M20 family metallopeptidase [unclassified Microbacterium]|uniref:M20 metallopeptidase family protein n=1 Tax=unclassified Microbacterium TaxID=2609290 RepID=UPI000EA8C15E|nr:MULTISPECIES: M20 family metallopeptidase [unclassified Microbacterium]MBT2486413.1 amidohydrolase [Microbacterium sp. ISL-108]RKN69115.1 amidohydrolase [Microbacterium sp. CGR2]